MFFGKNMSSIPELQADIKRHYLRYSQAIRIDCKMWFTDKARQAQDFFVALWNALWGLSLKNWDFITKNLPYIDLVDEKNKIVIQVTVDQSREKLMSTVKWFAGNYSEKYDNLKMRYIGEKSKDFIKLDEFDIYKWFFDISKDLIFDINICKKVEEVQDHAALLRIKKIMSDFFESIEVQRIGYKEVSRALNLIKNSIEELNVYKKWDLLNPNIKRIEDVDFMTKKDKLNEMQTPFYEKWLLFDSKIMELLWQDDDLREIYNDVVASIKALWEEEKILNLFTYVLSKIPYKEEQYRKDCWTILENMYFNCDVWKNPDVASW